MACDGLTYSGNKEQPHLCTLESNQAEMRTGVKDVFKMLRCPGGHTAGDWRERWENSQQIIDFFSIYLHSIQRERIGLCQELVHGDCHSMLIRN